MYCMFIRLSCPPTPHRTGNEEWSRSADGYVSLSPPMEAALGSAMSAAKAAAERQNNRLRTDTLMYVRTYVCMYEMDGWMGGQCWL